MDGLTEEQAQAEIDRINEEKEQAMLMVGDPSVFNEDQEAPVENPNDSKDNKQKQDETKKEEPKKESEK
jgi:hypothetical protein